MCCSASYLSIWTIKSGHKHWSLFSIHSCSHLFLTALPSRLVVYLTSRTSKVLTPPSAPIIIHTLLSMLLMDAKGRRWLDFSCLIFLWGTSYSFSLGLSLLIPFPHFPLGGWVSQCDVSLGEASCGLCSLTKLVACTERALYFALNHVGCPHPCKRNSSRFEC